MLPKIRPLYDRVLIKRVETEDKTQGGIIIPDTAKEKGQIGEVIAVGQGKLSKDGQVTPLQVKAGDKVFFGKYSGTDVGDDHIILREDEILGIVQD
ncbi:co-chaperone GroES [Candidatus Dependentiae bacterium]